MTTTNSCDDEPMDEPRRPKFPPTSFAALIDAHPRWLEHLELMRATGCSRGATDWALRYLIENGLAQAIESARNAGMVEEHRMVDAHPGGDVVIFFMRREHCRFLNWRR